MHLIETQIKCVKHELSRRKKFFPKLVESGKMSTDTMEYEINVMQAVYETLTQLKGMVK